MRRTAPAIIATCIIVLMFSHHARAQLRPGLAVSPQKVLDEKDYPGIPTYTAFIPSSPGSCHTAVAGTTHQNACDTIPLDLGAPKQITPADAYLLKIILSWQETHTEGDQGLTSNFLDMYFYDCPNYKPPSTYGTCTRYDPPTQFINAAASPITIKLQDFPGKLYFIVVVNVYGPNLGYHLKAEYIPESYRARPAQFPEKPGTRASEASPPQRSATSKGRVPSGAEPEPEVSLSPVKVPGPDGEPTTVLVPVLASGKLKPASEEGLSPFVYAAAAVLLAGGSLSAFLIVRRRRRGEGASP